MVYVKIKENSEQARALIQLLKTMHFVEFIDKGDISNPITTKAKKEDNSGKVKKFKSVQDMFTYLKNIDDE